MKNYKKILILLFIPALLSLAGCNKKDDVPDFNDDVPDLRNMTEQEIQALFVGEWQEIARGNNQFPELGTDGHTIEFLTNGIYLTSLNDERIHYSLDSEFLYLNGGKTPDGYIYRHTFIGNRNKFRLDYVYGLIEDSGGAPKFHIYKRIK
jgi:hypothetical protein